MARNKKLQKTLYSLLLIIVVFVLGLATIILYPQPLFANKVEYKQFNVFSNEKIGDEIKPILDTAIVLVRMSELYDSAYQVDIFLADKTFFNKVDNTVFGAGPAARPIDNNLVFKYKVDIGKNLVYPNFPKPCKIGFAYAIAHEMTHCLQAHKYGVLKFNPFKHPEMWKLEGYPEYISRHKFSASIIDLKKELETFINLRKNQTGLWVTVEEGSCDVPEIYYKSRLMIEYLMNTRHMSYDQILQDTSSEEEIYNEMIGWMKKD